MKNEKNKMMEEILLQIKVNKESKCKMNVNNITN